MILDYKENRSFVLSKGLREYPNGDIIFNDVKVFHDGMWTTFTIANHKNIIFKNFPRLHLRNGNFKSCIFENCNNIFIFGCKLENCIFKNSFYTFDCLRLFKCKNDKLQQG